MSTLDPTAAPRDWTPSAEPGDPRGRGWLWWLGLVLASGAGLVALAVINLWRAVRDGDARAVLDAQRNAVAMGSSLNAVLRAPELLDAVLPEQRFRLVRGRLEVPPEVEWLDVPERWSAEPVMDLELEGRFAEAERLEFGEGDGDAALAGLRDLLESERLGERARAHVLMRCAWIAQRAGKTEACDEFVLGLDGVRGQLAVSAALLVGARGGELSVNLQRELVRMPHAQIDPVCARLGERGLDVEEIQAVAHAVARWRKVLQIARDSNVVGDRLGRGGAVVGPRVVEDRLVLLHREGGGSGEGLVLTFGQLADALERPAPMGLPALAITGDVVPLAEPVVAPDPSADGMPEMPVDDGEGEGEGVELAEPFADVVVVVPDFVGIRPLSPADSLWARPWVLGGVVGGLGLLFGAGLFFSLRAARREAAAMAARADFLTVVTHELKTPLASIRLLSEMLDEGRVAPDRVREYYSLLWGESARLTMLIENVLDLGRMERGERAYDLRGQSTEEVVGEATNLIRPLMEKEGIVLEFFPWSTETWVDMDRGAMLQALLNVLDNARKYAADGRRVEVATRPGVDGDGSPKHEILIRDFGTGIREEEREGVFQRFKRGAAQMDGSVPGVGLGLYLARSIMRRHGGDLLCETPEDGAAGAWFRFVLPLGEQPLLRQSGAP